MIGTVCWSKHVPLILMKYKDEITSWLRIVTINDDNTGVLYHKWQLNIPHGNVIYWMTILNLNTEYSLETLLKLCTKHASVFLLTVHLLTCMNKAVLDSTASQKMKKQSTWKFTQFWWAEYCNDYNDRSWAHY